ncbi:MAG: Rieske (2Fe-2S) protein [Acidimicrobiales bacterium]
MSESRYVIDDRDTPRFRVHRSTMVDPAILEEERRKIFDACWLYVGHESEIPEPHDFRTRSVGGRPVILTRDATGRVQVFANVCPHRGMQIETRPEGHGRFLKCFYHGWSFSTAGEAVALPDEPSYGDGFDRHNLCLPRPRPSTPTVGSCSCAGTRATRTCRPTWAPPATCSTASPIRARRACG